jgi:hypothetical protein
VAYALGTGYNPDMARLYVGDKIKLLVHSEVHEGGPFLVTIEHVGVGSPEDDPDHPLHDNRILVKLPKPMTVNRIQYQFCLLVGRNSWRIEDAIERGYYAAVTAAFIQPRKHLNEMVELNDEDLDRRAAFSAEVGPADADPRYWTDGYTTIPRRRDIELLAEEEMSSIRDRLAQKRTDSS